MTSQGPRRLPPAPPPPAGGRAQPGDVTPTCGRRGRGPRGQGWGRGARGSRKGPGMRGEAGWGTGAAAGTGATHPGRDPQQGLGPPCEAHGVQGGPRAARAERGSLHGRRRRDARPRRPLSVRPCSRPRPRPPGCAAEAAGAAAAAAASRERAPAAAGARGAGPSRCPPPTGPCPGLEPAPPSAPSPPARFLHLLNPGLRCRPRAGPASGTGAGSPRRPHRWGPESAREADAGLRDRPT